MKKSLFDSLGVEDYPEDVRGHIGKLAGKHHDGTSPLPQIKFNEQFK